MKKKQSEKMLPSLHQTNPDFVITLIGLKLLYRNKFIIKLRLCPSYIRQELE